MPDGSFQTKALLEMASARFGIERFRLGQDRVMLSVLGGRNTLAIMPTGAGKSLCYQVPALLMPGITIVVSPLLALVQDQYDKLASLHIEVFRFDSTQRPREETEALARLATIQNAIVFATPERVASAGFLECFAAKTVSQLVVDEAHCISQWGHDFRPAYLRLGDAAQRLNAQVVLALTATAPKAVRQDILQQLRMEEAEIFDAGLERANLRYAVESVHSEARQLGRLRELLARLDGPGIVYAATIRNVEWLHEQLTARGLSVGRYHGKMSSRDRERMQGDFMSGNGARVMLATNAFGLGVDKADLRFVIHYNMPGSLESYYQEAGRAGRDGEPADCVLLYRPGDLRIQSYFLGGRYPRIDQALRVTEELAQEQSRSGKPVLIQDLAERAGTPLSKTRVIAAFLSHLDLVAEHGAEEYSLRSPEPIDAAELEAAMVAYADKRDQDRDRLATVVRYAESQLCRNRILYNYFGYRSDGAQDCGRCDNCERAERQRERRRGARAVTELRELRQQQREAQRLSGENPEPAESAAHRQRLKKRGRPLKVPNPRLRPMAGELCAGDLVHHDTWGDGEVLRTHADAVYAFFPAHGEKLLKASFLKKR